MKVKCRKSLHNHSINLVYNVPISVLYLYSSVMFVCAKQCGSLPPARSPECRRVGGHLAVEPHLILWSVSNFPALVSAAGPMLSLAGAGDLAGLWWPPWAGSPRGRRTIILPLTLAPAASLSLSDQPRVQALDRVPVTSLHCSSLRRDISVCCILLLFQISAATVTMYTIYIRITMSTQCRGPCRTMLVCWCHCVCCDGIAGPRSCTASTPQHSPINLDCSPPHSLSILG